MTPFYACVCTSVKFLSVTKMVLLCIGRSDSACAYWQEKGFSGHNAYSVSKLANLMFSNELAPLMKQQGVTVNCVHPGIIATNVLHDVTEVVRTPRYSLPLLPVLRACWRTCLDIYHVVVLVCHESLQLHVVYAKRCKGLSFCTA